MDKITELINKKDYYLVTEVTSFKTRLSQGTPRIKMSMYDNNDNLVASFGGGEHDDYTVYDELNEKLEAMFSESLYKYEHIERLFEEIRDVESAVPEHLRNKPVIVKSESGGNYKLLLKTTAQDNVILSFNLLQSSNMINVNAITFGNDLSRLHSYIHIIEEYLKVPAKERRKELNSVDNFKDLV